MCKRIEARKLKYFIYSSNISLLGIGSILIWIGFLIQSSDYVQLLEYTYIGYIILFCGSSLIIISFIGIVGAWKTNYFLICLYTLSVILIGALLIIFGAIILQLRNKSSEYFSSKSNCIKHFKDADQVSVLSSKVLCKLYCPCNLDEDTASQLGLQNFYKGAALNIKSCNPCEKIQTYEPDVQQELIVWMRNVLGANVTVTECAVTSQEFKEKYFEGKYFQYFSLLAWVEDKFGCSGLCTAQNVQVLNDVRNDVSGNACFRYVENWSQEKFLAYAIASIIIGVYQFCTLFFSLSLCYCPKRKFDMPPENLTTPSQAFKA